MTAIPPRLLLTAGTADAVRQQLGRSAGRVPEPLDLDLLPLSAGLRDRLRHWADSFARLHSSTAIDGDAARSWAGEAFAVSAALARELDPGVRLRCLAHAASGHLAGELIAGLFDDDLRLPEMPGPTGWTAYQSTLTLEFGGGAGVEACPPQPWLTADRTDATDDELGELRRRAVDPVVHTMLTADELASSALVVYQENGAPEISLWLEVRDEEMRHWLWHPDCPPDDAADPVDVAARLADSMSDWVCETRFGWGQLRIPVYAVLPAR